MTVKHCNGLSAVQVAGHAALPWLHRMQVGCMLTLQTFAADSPEPPRMCPSASPQSSLFARPAHRKSYAGSNYSHMNSEEKEVELPAAPHLNGMGPTPGTSPKAVSGPPLTTGARSKSEAAVQPILDQAAMKAQEAQKAQEGYKPAQVGKTLRLTPPHEGLEPGCAGGGCLPTSASAEHAFADRQMSEWAAARREKPCRKVQARRTHASTSPSLDSPAGLQPLCELQSGKNFNGCMQPPTHTAPAHTLS